MPSVGYEEIGNNGHEQSNAILHVIFRQKQSCKDDLIITKQMKIIFQIVWSQKSDVLT